MVRRAFRSRRWQCVAEWLECIAVDTRDGSLAQQWLNDEYGETISRIQADPQMSGDIKSCLREHFELIRDNADRINTVCCHGDVWPDNILWRRAASDHVVLDWGAARWPGLPIVDLCRYGANSGIPEMRLAKLITRYCRRIDLEPRFVPALYDLYNVFVKAELDEAFATQPHKKSDPFRHGLPSRKLSRSLAATS